MNEPETTESRVAEILLRWEDLREAGREPALEEICGDEPGLVDVVRRRVAALRAMDGPLGAGSTDDATEDDLGPAGRSASPRRGVVMETRFERMEFHASGGLGEVYRAVNPELAREVALKFLRPGRSREPSSLRRFQFEAEVTGRLEHPGIVPVHGTGRDEQGSPCYAMRFVEGETLSAAISRAHEAKAGSADRASATRALVRRLVAACHAIEYAHSRGIIHRDIKPQNILLGPFQETLVVDWGLAKAVKVADAAEPEDSGPVSLLDDPYATQGTVGTAAYMSPEQAAGNTARVGPASDVAGLGATLYAIMTARPPYGADTQSEALRRARSGEFAAPRSVDPAIPKALDAILRKAMALEASGRYASARAMADDLTAWLEDEPVSAYREPFHVRALRWGRRHKTAVAAVAVLLASTTVALAVGGVLVSRERDRAEANFRMAMAAVDRFHTQVSEDKLLKVPGLQPLRKGLLESAREFYDDFARLRRSDPTVRLELARSMQRLGAITRETRSKEESIPFLVEADALLAGLPQDVKTREVRAVVASNLGLAYNDLGKWDDSDRAYRDAIAFRKRPDGTLPADPDDLRALAILQFSRAATALEAHRHDVARVALDDALAWANSALGAKPNDPETLRALANIRNNRGILEGRAGTKQAEVFEYAEAVKLLRRVAPSSGDFEVRDDLAMALVNEGTRLRDTGRPDEGAEMVAESVSTRRALVADNPTVLKFRNSLALALNELGLARRAQGRDPEAEAAFNEGIERAEALVRDHPGVPEYREILILNLVNYVNSLKNDPGRKAKLEPIYDRAVQVAATLGDDPEGRRLSARTYASLSDARRAQDQPREAEALVRKGLAVFVPLADAPNAEVDDVASCVEYLVDLGRILGLEGKDAEAQATLDDAIGRAERVARLKPDLLPKLATALYTLGNQVPSPPPSPDAFARKVAAYERALEIRRAIVKERPGDIQERFYLGEPLMALVMARLDAGGDPARLILDVDEALAGFNPVRASRPGDEQVRIYAKTANLIRGILAQRLGRNDEAIRSFEEVIKCIGDRDEPYRVEVRVGILVALAHSGRAVEAVGRAEAFFGDAPPAGELYNFTCVDALAADATRKDDRLDPSKKAEAVERLRARAVARFARAVAAGNLDAPEKRAEAKIDPDLDSLRDREDFRRAWSDLEARPLPGPAPSPK